MKTTGKNKRRFFLLLVPGLLFSFTLRGQLSGNNLFEYQLGNIPGIEPTYLSTHYDNLNLSYKYKQVKAYIRLEHFMTPEEERNYLKLSQYNLRFRQKGFEIQLGHFNEMLGNGLLFRTYEIPSSIFEDQAYRVRYGFYKDALGFMAQYRHDWFYFKASRGKTLVNQLPPTLDEEERREDLVEAVEGGVTLAGQTLGLIFLRNHRDEATRNYSSIRLQGNIVNNINYNAEFASGVGNKNLLDIGSDTSRYALYISANYFLNNLGLSVEWKDYNNFFLGSGFNDPPTLVKEHNAKLLNRNTHVPQLVNERGYQAEIYYTFDGGQRITFNHAWAINNLSIDFQFREYYAQFASRLFTDHHLEFFLDYAVDEIAFKDDIYTVGAFYSFPLANGWSTSADIEYQQFKRIISTEQDATNFLFSFSLAKSTLFSVSPVLEVSTDPFITDRVNTPAVEESARFFPGINISVSPNHKHRVSLFAGERRGGPACLSGICYEVLDFKGFEIRLTSRF
jgi:hypothetical protein